MDTSRSRASIIARRRRARSARTFADRASTRRARARRASRRFASRARARASTRARRRVPSDVRIRGLRGRVRRTASGNRMPAAGLIRCMSRSNGTVRKTPRAVRLKGVSSRSRLGVSSGSCRFGDTGMGSTSYSFVKMCGSAIC